MAFLGALCVSANVYAQNFAYEVLPDKEALNIKQMGLPENLSVKDLLLVYPSILNRRSEYVIDGYEVQMDGQAVGYANDVILMQTKLGELEKIEISSSPSVTQQRNGQGGVINLVLRAPDKEGVSGSASLFAFTAVDIMPSLNLDYKHGGLVIRSRVNFEYYNSGEDFQIDERDISLVLQKDKTVKEKYLQESARFDLAYTSPSGNNVFKFWLREACDRDRCTTSCRQHAVYDKAAEMGEGWTFNEYSEIEDRIVSKSLSLFASSRYEHFFGPGHKIKLACDLNCYRLRDLKGQNHEQTVYPKTMTAEIQYKRPLMRGDYSLVMEGGCNYTSGADKVYAQKRSSIYVSPYLNLKYKHSVWTVNAGARYQHYEYLHSLKNWTFNINMVWQMLEHHALRLIGTKNISRPSESMLDSSFVRSPLDDSWKLGNPNLVPSSIYTTALKYIHDWRSGFDSFVFTCGFGYHYTDNGIATVQVNDDSRLFPYVTYINSNVKRTLFADVNLLYRHDIFSCEFTGNYFSSHEHDFDDFKDKCRYYNLSFSPIFRFRQHWTLGSSMIYHSRIKTKNATKGDCFCMYINLTKSLGRWSVFAEMMDVFGYKTWDHEWNLTREVTTGYNLYNRYVALGLTYKF